VLALLRGGRYSFVAAMANVMFFLDVALVLAGGFGVP
jgi:hypothetical protein